MKSQAGSQVVNPLGAEVTASRAHLHLNILLIPSHAMATQCVQYERLESQVSGQQASTIDTRISDSFARRSAPLNQRGGSARIHGC